MKWKINRRLEKTFILSVAEFSTEKPVEQIMAETIYFTMEFRMYNFSTKFTHIRSSKIKLRYIYCNRISIDCNKFQCKFSRICFVVKVIE